MNSSVEIKLSFDKVKDSYDLSVKIRISYKGDRKRIALLSKPVICSKEMFDKINKYHQTNNQRTGEEVRTIYAKFIEPSLNKSISIIDSLGDKFTFDKFIASYKGIISLENSTELEFLCKKRADELIRASQANYASLYILSGKSIQSFVNQLHKNECLRFDISSNARVVKLENITVQFLKEYEKWFVKTEGKSITTLGIYLRNIRAIFNEQISNNVLPKDLYPFGKKLYTIPASKNIKKAIPKETILQILNYDPLPGLEQRSKDFYTFSYLSNGMNMADILNLRWSNVDIKNRKMSFVRQKTENTTKGSQISISVQLFDESIKIIERWGIESKLPNDRVFPFLNDSMTPEIYLKTKKQFIKTTNYHMRKIAHKLGIEDDPVTMSARHSFATILMQSNTPALLISKLLGHTDFKTTQNYLSSFEDEQTKGYLDNLL